MNGFNIKQIKLLVTVTILFFVIFSCKKKQTVYKNKLIKAINFGTYKDTKDAINSGCNLSSKDRSGNPMLSISILMGKYDEAELLINSGADIEVLDSDGSTPLMIACTVRDTVALKIIKLLIDSGANVNAINKNKYSAMFFAVMFPKDNKKDTNAVNALSLLINAGASLKIRAYENETVLHCATFDNNILAVKYLLPLIDKNIKDEYGKTPLMIAKEKGFSEIVKMIDDFEK